MSARNLGLGNGRIFRRPLASLDPQTTVSTTNLLESLSTSPLQREALSELSETVESVAQRLAERARASFQPLPGATGPSPYRLNLETVLAANDIQRIRDQNLLVFLTAGDTGAKKRPEFQKQVIQSMVADCERPAPRQPPSFLYIIGDVVYFKGEADEYFPQFYEAFEDFPGPIFSIPGNHDGDGIENGRSLDAYVRNFCAQAPNFSRDAHDVQRDAMTQPNVFFTLETPLATIIGLYSNVPEGGVVEDDQKEWFVNELVDAPADKAVIVAVHHPLFSLDDHHSGSEAMLALFRSAITQSGRVPDLILTGHVHNYQRFTWHLESIDVPVIVAGAGGYPNLHKVKAINGHRLETPFRQANSDAVLEHYVDHRHGFLRLEISSDSITGKYYQTSVSENAPGERVDKFKLDLASRRLVSA